MTRNLVLGFDEAGFGEVLLLVHGFPLDRTIWRDQLKGLSDVHRVVAVDLRGRGRSPSDDLEEVSIDDYADDVAATIRSLGVSQVDLVGLSMGGYVALALWRRNPDLIRSIILVDTKSQDDSQEAKEGREKTAALVREKGTLELVNALFDKIFAPGATDDVKEHVKKMFQNTPSETAAADALAMRDRPDNTPLLAGITVPALVIHGEQDNIMPLESARPMADSIPGGRFVSIPNAGHMSPIENPDAVNQAIRVFLK